MPIILQLTSIMSSGFDCWAFFTGKKGSLEMRVFMVGWEFPPFISGGLGTACYGLTRAMDDIGVNVIFAMPKGTGSAGGQCFSNPGFSVQSISYDVAGQCEFKNVIFRTVASTLEAYGGAESYQRRLRVLAEEKLCGSEEGCGGFDVNEEAIRYGGNIYSEVNRYAHMIARIACGENFDVVHAHDWMTYPAGVAAARVSGKPLVVHIHSTEFDRSGENVNQMIYDIENYGLHKADRIIAVSNYTKNIIVSRYSVPPERVEVVYNGVMRDGVFGGNGQGIKGPDDKMVLFLGRMTMQKGPDYFVAAAKKVLDVLGNVKFVMAGAGDMMRRVVDMAADMGIGKKVLFTGFLSGEDIQKVYSMADLYVMPSVSEPFGIAPLEAINNDVPTLISKQSGVSEVLRHTLKVDFWDVNEIANKIVAVLRLPPLSDTLRKESKYEINNLSWHNAAGHCLQVYDQVIA